MISRLLCCFAILCWTCLGAAESSARAESTPALDGRRVLVLGDSITQDGRYVAYLEYLLLRNAAPIRSDVVSIGLGSETVSGLSEEGHPFPRPCVLTRLDRALELVRPDIVFACYGMNDGIYHPPSPERLAAFAAGLEQLIAAVRARHARLVLVTPPVFDAQPIRARLAAEGATQFGYGSPYAAYDDVLAAFARHELTLAGETVTVIDLHSVMARTLTARRVNEPGFTFAPDGVHPADEGHLVIARTIASQLGFGAPEGVSLADEVNRIAADPLFPLVAERRKMRSEAWLNYVGYTRGQTVRAASVSQAEAEVARLTARIDTLQAD